MKTSDAFQEITSNLVMSYSGGFKPDSTPRSEDPSQTKR